VRRVTNKVIVLSSAAALSSFKGHSYNYHLAVRDALRLSSIEYKVLIPSKNPITLQDEVWEQELRIPSKLVGDISSKIARFFAYAYYSICISYAWVFFYRKYSKSAEVIVFYETGGNFLDEILISIVLKIFVKKPLAVWYLVRGLPKTKKFQFLLKSSIFFAEFFVGKGRLKLCTDTVPLRDQLKYVLKRDVVCLPIPHAYSKQSKDQDLDYIKPNGLRIWGLSCMGENKGEKFLANLLRQKLTPSVNVEVIVRDFFLEKNELHPESFVKVIPSELDALQFTILLQSCHVALLPYFGGEDQAYKLSSSGIFVDSVTAGLLPLVSRDTWMEFELNRFDLNELVLDWDQYNTLPKLSTLINGLFASKSTMCKLDGMRRSYSAMHSPDGFLGVLYQNNYFPKFVVKNN